MPCFPKDGRETAVQDVHVMRSFVGKGIGRAKEHLCCHDACEARNGRPWDISLGIYIYILCTYIYIEIETYIKIIYIYIPMEIYGNIL